MLLALKKYEKILFPNLEVFNKSSLRTNFLSQIGAYGATYSRMDQVKFVEDSL